MKNIVLIVSTIFMMSYSFSQSLTQAQMEENASNQMQELIVFLETHQLVLTASQREEISKINMIVQDKINSIKQHPGDVLTQADIDEAIRYRNNHRIKKTKEILDPIQREKYNLFVPTSQLNHVDYLVD